MTVQNVGFSNFFSPLFLGKESEQKTKTKNIYAKSQIPLDTRSTFFVEEKTKTDK